MKRGHVWWLAIVLIFCGMQQSYADSVKSSVLAAPADNATNNQVKGFSEPTDNPVMSLLKGKIVYVDILPSLNVTRDSVHNGTGYILVKYNGKERLDDSATFIIKDLSDVTPINDMKFFAQLGGGDSGTININDLVKANVGLVNYNTHGYVIIQGLAGYNINSAHYDVTKNLLELLSGRENRVALSGGIIDFK